MTEIGYYKSVSEFGEGIEWGIDEVGVSSVAGSMVVVAYRAEERTPGVRDSKRLKSGAINALASRLAQTGEVVVIRVLPCAVDNFGWRKCLWKAVGIMPFGFSRALIDGRRLRDGLAFSVGADAEYYEVAAASILAKWFSNQEFAKIASLWPDYAWLNHYGYLTPAHQAELQQFGPVEGVHRLRRLRNILKIDVSPERDMGMLKIDECLCSQGRRVFQMWQEGMDKVEELSLPWQELLALLETSRGDQV